MKRPIFIATFVGAILIAVLGPACSAVSSGCSTYCERWKECIDSAISTDRCEDACVAWAKDNSDRESKVEKCDECLGQNEACSDTTRRCTADCLGIPVR